MVAMLTLAALARLPLGLVVLIDLFWPLGGDRQALAVIESAILLLGLVVVALLVAAVIYWGVSNNQASRFKAVYRQRLLMPDDTFVALEFADEDIDPAIPILVRKILAEHTGYYDELLRADDDLMFLYSDNDLSFDFDCLNSDDLLRDLEEAFQFTLTESDAEKCWVSIRDLSRVIARATGRTRKGSLAEKPGHRWGSTLDPNDGRP